MKLTDDVVLEATREYINHSTAYSPQYNPISAMRSALAVAVKMMSEWQPIETAPNSTEVIVSGFNFNDDKQGRWIVIANREYGLWNGLDNEVLYDPTHWMPLPTPPA